MRRIGTRPRDRDRGRLVRRSDVLLEPAFVERVENPCAIPQYDIGCEKFFAALDEAEKAFPLRFAGNFRGGISVAQTMLSALNAAEKI